MKHIEISKQSEQLKQFKKKKKKGNARENFSSKIVSYVDSAHSNQPSKHQ